MIAIGPQGLPIGIGLAIIILFIYSNYCLYLAMREGTCSCDCQNEDERGGNPEQKEAGAAKDYELL